jgi:beta-lactamase class A
MAASRTPPLVPVPSLSPPPRAEALDTLRPRLEALARSSGALGLSVAVHDTETGNSFGLNSDRWFHAASTIKVAILLGVYASMHQGWLLPHSRLHVRNRFTSAADGQPYRVLADRDANSAVHAAIGKMMRISELARHMIASSSNLATNLLLDLVGLDTVQRALDAFHIEGIDVRRGVEDPYAFEAGIINRVTADGMVQLLRVIAEERAFSPALSREMLRILHAQEFNSGIPARLPVAVRVAHKTGEISTIAHDAGVVYPEHRRPYVIAVLTEWAPEDGRRSATIAEASHAVYQTLTSSTAGPSRGDASTGARHG